MNNRVVIGLVAAVLFQLMVLGGMYVKAALPTWTGSEIKVQTIPVDPRSMFRGNYALLRYEFSELETKDSDFTEGLRHGEVVYVALEKNTENGLYEFSQLSLEKPDSGIFLRGRAQGLRYSGQQHLRVKYGIEAFFAPKEKALALEKELADGGVAVLMIATDGRARITDVLPNG